MLKFISTYIHDLIHFHYPMRKLKANKHIVQARLQKYFENTPYHSFELTYNSNNHYAEIISINNQRLPIHFFSTSLIRYDVENVKHLITYTDGDADAFLIEYNIKESELLMLYNKFNDNLLSTIGMLYFTTESSIKYENGKLSYHFKNLVI